MIKNCATCGKKFEAKTNASKYCSEECFKVVRKKRKALQTKTCIVCGKEFFDHPSNMTKTCSKECSIKNRQRDEHKSKIIALVPKAHEVAATHPLTGRFETNVNARSWKIQAPDGQVYECRNLKLWLRNHEDMLDGTVEQAWDGISKIKYSMQGKRKNTVSQWKGWLLLDWGD